MSNPQIKRDLRLRRRILEALDAARAGGGLRGRMLADILVDLPDGLDSDDHLLALLADLQCLNLVVVTDLRKYRDQFWTLDLRQVQITAKGTGLLAEREPVCGLVEDRRIA